jgi:hypothetical protein
MRANHATPSLGRRKLPVANENRLHQPPRVEKQRPTRWSDIGILVTIAPTLTVLTLIATYFFGIR